MNKKILTWLIIGASLIIIGCILFVGAMNMFNWDFTKLSTDKFETNKYDITNENFENISLMTKEATVKFLLSDSDKTTVVCYEKANQKHSVSVKDNTLLIEINDSRKWYEYIGINFDSPEITVYIPQKNYAKLSVVASTGDIEVSPDFNFASIDITVSTGEVRNYASATEKIKISTSTGNIVSKNISAGYLELSVSTGNINLSGINCTEDINTSVSTGKMNFLDITCKNFNSKGSTGDISLNNVIIENQINIERSTGKVVFEKCDANEIFVETDTGDVKGTLLSDKVFIVKTDTGKINVPQTTMGGKCEITTDTGDIKIEISK